MKKKIKEKGKIIRFCSRCGEEWCKLGKILEYGKHYPAYVVKFKNGKKKEYSAFDEIKKAVCRECAKELFDNELLKSEKEKWEKEKRVKNQLLEEVMQMKIPEKFPDRKTEGYNLALAELEEKLKESPKEEIKSRD